MEKNGGFASVRSLSARLDLANCDAFLIRVRGDGRRYKFSARTDRTFDGPIYQTSFPTKQGEWEELRLGRPRTPASGPSRKGSLCDFLPQA